MDFQQTNDVKNKTEFEKWWFKHTHPWTKYPKDPMEIAEISFNAGWEAHAAEVTPSRTVERETAERSSSEQAARQIEQSEWTRKFLALASTAFLAGHDDEANMYRNIANHLI